ncbi:hypothetical protein CMI37_13860 [Candidatus Pacearchaeota archaeon]|nr:hypothetical protein [Candidatus Pacearchaeota archaeon]|tara:strand:- start:533 stop:997 length:465 start_codon:yes stop_codon:yes gene_type:complete
MSLGELIIAPSVGLAPVDCNGGKTTDIVNTQLYDRIDFLVYLGVTGAASTLTVEECDDVTPSNSTAIAFDYEVTATANSDDFGSITRATSSGISLGSSDDGKMWILHIRSSELTEDYPYVRVSLADPSGSSIVCIIPLCYGARYMKETMPTAIT